jgi:hypothetical protein
VISDSIVRRSLISTLLLVAGSVPAHAQVPAPHDHAASQPSAWHVMQDGVLFLTVNHQGGPRGGDELAAQNWWKGMAQRPVGRGTLTFNLMLSAEPLTLGRDGYREIFQAGEALDHVAVIDRQHPHDFLVQAAAVWRVPLARGYALTIAGAPVGEPALGPVAFMHRASAAEQPTAPLAHHTMDSTHIAMGVLTAGIDRGPWQLETSIFRGREPDDDRWDLMDPGALDSWSVRGWYRPSGPWTVQVSHGFLNEPEELEAGDMRRTTGSVSYARGATAATIAYGRNDKPGKDFNAWLAEATRTFGANALYGRFEAVQVETDLLRFGVHGFGGRKNADVPEGTGGIDVVSAVTLGASRRIARRAGWDVSAGADATMYAVPGVLEPTHGARPVSFHVFLRIRPPAPMGRMIDVTMTRMMR